MPMIKLTVTDPAQNQSEVLAEASRIVAAVTGKPESYVMAFIEQGSFLMAGKPCAGAFVEVRGIGKIEREINAEISRQICAMLQQKQGIAPQNIYLNFTDVPGSNWGNANGTF